MNLHPCTIFFSFHRKPRTEDLSLYLQKKKELLKPNHCIFSVRVGGNQNSTCAIAGQCHGGKIGVCYGRNADDLPAPDKVAQLIQQQSIKYVRIYDSNIDVIKAFANTGVELMVGVLSRTAIAKTAYASSWGHGPPPPSVADLGGVGAPRMTERR